MVFLVVGPHLAVDVRVLWRHHRRLRRGRLPFLRERIHRHLVGLAIDLGDAGLVHQRDPDVLVVVELDVEVALRLLLFEHRDRDVLDLAGLRVEHAGELRAEVGVPGHAVAIDDHVVRLRLFARQVVLGDDHAGGLALGAHLGLKVVFGRVRIAERDAGEIGGGRLGLVAGYGRALAARTRQQRLRAGRRAAGRVAAHAIEHLLVLGRIMRRGEHALQGVAADALDHELLLLVGARQAAEPLAVGKRRGEIARLAELEVGRGGRAHRHLGGLRSDQGVACGADRDRVLAGRKPVGREAVIALLIGHHRDGDGGALFLGVHQNAFHVAFLLRGNDARQGGAGLRQRALRQAERKDADSRQQAEVSQSH